MRVDELMGVLKCSPRELARGTVLALDKTGISRREIGFIGSVAGLKWAGENQELVLAAIAELRRLERLEVQGDGI